MLAPADQATGVRDAIRVPEAGLEDLEAHAGPTAGLGPDWGAGGPALAPPSPPHPPSCGAGRLCAPVSAETSAGGPGGRGAGRGNKATEPRRAGLSPGGGGSSPGLPSPLLSALPHASVQMKEFEGTRKKYGSYFQNWNQLQLGIKHPHVSRSSGLWVPPSRGGREGARRSGPESEGGSTLAPVPVASSAHPEVTPCTPRAHTQCSHPELTPGPAHSALTPTYTLSLSVFWVEALRPHPNFIYAPQGPHLPCDWPLSQEAPRGPRAGLGLSPLQLTLLPPAWEWGPVGMGGSLWSFSSEADLMTPP